MQSENGGYNSDMTYVSGRTIIVEKNLMLYRSDAIERLFYLYPSHNFEIVENGILVDGPESTILNRDIYYTLHRAKIAAESEPLRALLFHSVLHR